MKRVLLVLSLLFAVAPAHAQAIVGIGGAMSDDDILDAIERVDGPGSQLDADFLDGISSQGYCQVTGGVDCPMVGCITIDNAGNPNSTYCEDGIDRVSATDTTYTIQNSGAGGMTFQVSGNITAAAAGASCVSGTPGYAFAGDLDSGFANDGVGTTRFCSNANTVGEMSSTALSMYVPIYATPGATGAQGIAFRNDTNTGIYNNGSGGMFFEADAVQVATMSTTGVVFNESGSATKDLRVEGDTNANLIFADAGSDAVGIGTNVQLTSNRMVVSLDQSGTDIDTVNAALAVRNPNTTNGSFSMLGLQSLDTGGTLFGAARVAARINSHTAATINADLIFQTRAGSGSNWTEPVIFTHDNYAGFGTLVPGARMDVRGLAGIPALIVNENGLDSDVRMESDTNPDMFVLDASANAIGFGTNAPGAGTVTTAVDIWPSTDGARWLGASGLGWAGVLVDSGSAASPAVAFDDDPDTGMWFPAADTIGWSTGGTSRGTVSTTAFTSTVPYLGPAGSASAPSFALSADPDTGWYSVGTNAIGIALGGSNVLTIVGSYFNPATGSYLGSTAAPWSSIATTIVQGDDEGTNMLITDVDGITLEVNTATNTVWESTGMAQPEISSTSVAPLYMRPGGNVASSSPTKPTCNTSSEGAMIYIDDTSDGIPGTICYCGGSTDRASFGWVNLADNTNCP